MYELLCSESQHTLQIDLGVFYAILQYSTTQVLYRLCASNDCGGLRVRCSSSIARWYQYTAE